MLIEVDQLSYHAGQKAIVDKVSFAIDKGQIIGLIGPNGAGKTSLLKLLANILKVEQGQYRFNGKAIQSYKEKVLAKHMAYLAQNATAHWPLKARRLIELGRLPWQGYRQQLSKQDQEKIEQAIAISECQHLLDRVVTTLSGGEQTRIFLARLFAGEPEVIFADEPIAALDPYHQLHIMEILKQHAKQGGTVVVVMHDIHLASRFCDQLILMDQGKILRFGTLQELLADDLLAKTYRIDLKMFCEKEAYAIVPWQRRV